jgi:hypothetical protein
VEPAGSGLVTASPVEPAGGVPGGLGVTGGGREQPLDLVDGKGDQARIGGWCLVRGGRRRGLAAGAVPELGGGDGADGKGCHDQHEVAQDRGVEAGLALVQAEVAFAEPESLLSRPLLIPVKRKRSLASRRGPERYSAWEHCCRRRLWFAGCGQRRRVSAMRPSAGNAVTPDPVVWVLLPPERRAAAVALLAMLAARAAARVAGGGRDEPA